MWLFSEYTQNLEHRVTTDIQRKEFYTMENPEKEQESSGEDQETLKEKQESLFKRGLKGLLLGITMVLVIYMVGVFAYGV
jgi:hypothetical protein